MTGEAKTAVPVAIGWCRRGRRATCERPEVGGWRWLRPSVDLFSQNSPWRGYLEGRRCACVSHFICRCAANWSEMKMRRGETVAMVEGA